MRGRKSKFKKEFAEQARKLCELGATDFEIADFFKVCQKTVDNWKIAHPEFLRSIKLGKESADERVERALYHRAVGYSHPAEKIFNSKGRVLRAAYVEHYPPEPKAAIHWLNNRKSDQWRDRIEHTGANGGPMTYREEVPVERRELDPMASAAGPAT